MAHRPNTNAPSDHHVDFLQQFVAKERERAAKPAPLSAQEHAANRKRLGTVRFVKPKYCSEMNVGDWRATIVNLTRDIVMDFFLFVCSNYRVRSWGTSEEYMRQFQQLYTTVTGQYMDRNDAKEVYKYHHHILVPRFGLRAPNIDGKPVLNEDSLRLLCYTGVRPAELVDGQRKGPKDGSLEKLFGRKVVQDVEADVDSDAPDEETQHLDQLLLQETTKRGRPKALCYEDILLMLVRHPTTGATIPAMAIKFIHHKGADNKPKPTIFFFTPTRKLLFNVIMVIIALALDDNAFDAPSLTDAASVYTKHVPGPTQCIPLRWKKEKLKIPVFRRIQGTLLSEVEPMTYSKLYYDMGRQSLDAGFEKAWTPRFARRGAANAANGDAPDSVRDQMMRHDPKFATFSGAYLNENARFDLQNAFLEEEKQDQLFRMFAHVSLTRDPRAVRDMVPEEVWINTPPDPEIMALEEERAALKQGRYRIEGHVAEKRIRELTNKISTKRATRDRTIVKEYREYYFYNRPTWDIEAQARDVEEEAYEVPTIDLTIPERARLADLLCFQPTNWTDEEATQYNIEATNLMSRVKQQMRHSRRRRFRRAVVLWALVDAST
ncbi:FluG domain-containing protein [Purpureocillium lilacinum]|uniref:FluG domain-containing protein n=1 Tax=Purpureocillium lilacinum TaxID=33203 RepID=A0A179F4M8_PURLI|nr:FluG domain-containing protein [Purpureocillium lilacinum]